MLKSWTYNPEEFTYYLPVTMKTEQLVTPAKIRVQPYYSCTKTPDSGRTYPLQGVGEMTEWHDVLSCCGFIDDISFERAAFAMKATA
jgi:hypothetical protein